MIFFPFLKKNLLIWNLKKNHIGQMGIARVLLQIDKLYSELIDLFRVIYNPQFFRRWTKKILGKSTC